MVSSSTMKFQPLHNFSLPDLKWAMNHTNTHCLCKPFNPSDKYLNLILILTLRLTTTKITRTIIKVRLRLRIWGQAEKKEKDSGCTSFVLRIEKLKVTVVAPANHVVENNNSEKKLTSSDDTRSKTFIHFRTKNNKNIEDPTTDVGDQGSVTEFVEDFLPKMWNLRPRRPVIKCPNVNRGGAMTGGKSKPHPNKNRPDLARSRNGRDTKDKKDKGKEKVKDKKPKFSITPTKEEIDEDIFLMTGVKPSRRPKKRNKNVQKQLDN